MPPIPQKVLSDGYADLKPAIAQTSFWHDLHQGDLVLPAWLRSSVEVQTVLCSLCFSSPPDMHFSLFKLVLCLPWTRGRVCVSSKRQHLTFSLQLGHNETNVFLLWQLFLQCPLQASSKSLRHLLDCSALTLGVYWCVSMLGGISAG